MLHSEMDLLDSKPRPVQKVQIEVVGLFKNITTFDLTWMLVKLTLAFLFSTPVIVLVILFWTTVASALGISFMGILQGLGSIL